MGFATTFVLKYRRILLWAGGILFTYTLLGFLFLPWFAEQQLVKILDQRLSLSSQVERIYFNPFSFFVEVEGLTIDDDDGSDLVQLENLHLNFQASRLFLLKVQFSEFVVNGLDLYFQRNSTTDNNIQRLSQRWADSSESEAVEVVVDASDESEEGEESELFPVEITLLEISDVTVHALDEVPDTPFTTSINLVDARIDNFSTFVDVVANNSVAIGLEQDASLNWTGGFSLNPLVFTGSVALENLGLDAVSRYLQDTVPFTVDEGKLNLAFGYYVDLSQDAPEVIIDEIFTELTELEISQSANNSTFLSTDSLSLSNGQVTLPENRATFEVLTLGEFDISLVRNDSGDINLQTMVSELTESSNSDSTTNTVDQPAAGEPWFVALDTFEIENARLGLTDESMELPFNIAATLNSTITGINNQSQSSIPLSSNITLDSGGEIQLQGNLQVIPEIDFSSNVTINDLDLTPLQAILNEFALIELQSGVIGLEAELSSNTVDPLTYRGDFRLQNVEVADQQLDEPLLSMDQLAIDALDFSLANNNLDISEVFFDSFFARVVINEDGTTNLSRSIRPAPEQAATTVSEETEADTAQALSVTVGRVRVENARSNFTDKNLPIIFDTNIQSLSGTADGFSTNSSQPMEISLEGQVDEFGLVQIDSSLNPFDIMQQSQASLIFRNLDMPAMSPYVIKFAGREIADGRVDVDLVYNIEASELEANNQVVLRDLILGERVEHPDAMDLPLDLAIALLKDGNGVIDLEVPVSGNVDDPEFSLGPVIRQAISNILTNIVAAPFRLLGNLIGGDSGDIDRIKFLPGRSDIAAPEQLVLQQLHTALLQRPQLALEIPPLSGEADVLALQTTAVTTRIDNLTDQSTDSEASLTDRRLIAVESLYNQANMTPLLAEVQLLHSVDSEELDPVSGVATITTELDTLAYSADLRDRLIAREPVSETELSTLADARMNAAIQYLIELGELDATRLLPLDVQESELDEDGWLIMEFDIGPLDD